MKALFIRMLEWLGDQGGHLPAAEREAFLGRHPFGEQQVVGRQIALKTSIIVATCFRAIVKRVLGEDSREESIQNIFFKSS